MIAHVVEFSGTRAQIRRAVRLLESDVNPVLMGRDGFVESVVMVDESIGKGFMVSLWGDEAAICASEARWAREGATQGALEAAGCPRNVVGRFDVVSRVVGSVGAPSRRVNRSRG